MNWKFGLVWFWWSILLLFRVAIIFTWYSFEWEPLVLSRLHFLLRGNPAYSANVFTNLLSGGSLVLWCWDPLVLSHSPFLLDLDPAYSVNMVRDLSSEGSLVLRYWDPLVLSHSPFLLQCDPAYSASMFMDLLSGELPCVMMLGAACSDVTAILAELSAYRNLVQVSLQRWRERETFIIKNSS